MEKDNYSKLLELYHIPFGKDEFYKSMNDLLEPLTPKTTNERNQMLMSGSDNIVAQFQGYFGNKLNQEDLNFAFIRTYLPDQKEIRAMDVATETLDKLKDEILSSIQDKQITPSDLKDQIQESRLYALDKIHEHQELSPELAQALIDNVNALAVKHATENGITLSMETNDKTVSQKSQTVEPQPTQVNRPENDKKYSLVPTDLYYNPKNKREGEVNEIQYAKEGKPENRLYQIRAERDIPEAGVKKGDLGGFVTSEENLSQQGSCWVGKGCAVTGKDARVSENAQLTGNVLVTDKAQVSQSARVSGHSTVFNKAQVKGATRISGHSEISGQAVLWGGKVDSSRVMGKATVWRGEVADSTLAGNAKAWSGKVTNSEITGHAYIGGADVRQSKIGGDTRLDFMARWGSLAPVENVKLDKGSFESHKDFVEYMKDHPGDYMKAPLPDSEKKTEVKKVPVKPEKTDRKDISKDAPLSSDQHQNIPSSLKKEGERIGVINETSTLQDKPEIKPQQKETKQIEINNPVWKAALSAINLEELAEKVSPLITPQKMSEEGLKYSLVPVQQRNKKFPNIPLYVIKAEKDIPEHNIKKGQLGGYVSSENNLSQKGTSWIDRGSMVIQNARIINNAHIKGSNVAVYNNAIVSENVVLSGQADIHGHASIIGTSKLDGINDIQDNAIVKDSKLSGANSIIGEVKIINSELRFGTRENPVLLTNGELINEVKEARGVPVEARSSAIQQDSRQVATIGLATAQRVSIAATREARSGIEEGKDYGLPLRKWDGRSDAMGQVENYSPEKPTIGIVAKEDTSIYASEKEGKVVDVYVSKDPKIGSSVTVAYPRPDGSNWHVTYSNLKEVNVKLNDTLTRETELGKTREGFRMETKLVEKSQDPKSAISQNPIFYLSEVAQMGKISQPVIGLNKDGQLCDKLVYAADPTLMNQYGVEATPELLQVQQACRGTASMYAKLITDLNNWQEMESNMDDGFGGLLFKLISLILMTKKGLSETDKLEAISQASKKVIDLSELTDGKKACKIDLSDGKRAAMIINTGDKQEIHELSKMQLEKVERILNDTTLSLEAKKSQIGGVGGVIDQVTKQLPLHVAEGYEHEMEKTQTQEQGIKR